MDVWTSIIEGEAKEIERRQTSAETRRVERNIYTAVSRPENMAAWSLLEIGHLNGRSLATQWSARRK
jgi:hypothetical protein